MDREADFNLLNSQSSPYCNICSLLGTSEDTGPIPASSLVQIPDELFGKVMSEVNLSPLESSPLMRCASCRICVHARCYGLPSEKSELSWLCRRCSRNDEAAKCCLCLQRGGPLKPTTDSRWAHILCALCFPGVTFSSPTTLEPIEVGTISAVLLSTCAFCNGRHDCSNVFYRGVCVSCSELGCQKTFHPTCALVNGVRFTLSSTGRLVSSCCSTGPLSSSSSKRKNSSSINNLKFEQIAIGQLVYAKHPSGGRHLVIIF